MPQTSTVLCRQLGIGESFSFGFIDHIIVADRKTSEEAFELIKDIVQELMMVDITDLRNGLFLNVIRLPHFKQYAK